MLSQIRDGNNELIVGDAKILDTWKNYIYALFNDVGRIVASPKQRTLDGSEILENEVRYAIQMWKGNFFSCIKKRKMGYLLIFYVAENMFSCSSFWSTKLRKNKASAENPYLGCGISEIELELVTLVNSAGLWGNVHSVTCDELSIKPTLMECVSGRRRRKTN